MGMWGITYKSKENASEVRKPTKKRSSLGKGRSSRTNQNKTRKLKSFYEGLFKRSQELKQSNKYPKKTKYFCDRYSTLDSFSKYYPLKQVMTKR